VLHLAGSGHHASDVTAAMPYWLIVVLFFILWWLAKCHERNERNAVKTKFVLFSQLPRLKG